MKLVGTSSLRWQMVALAEDCLAQKAGLKLIPDGSGKVADFRSPAAVAMVRIS